MNPMLTGLHHLTAVTARAGENFAFYTQTLGMGTTTLNRDIMNTTWRRALLSVLTVDLGVAVASRVVAAP